MTIPEPDRELWEARVREGDRDSLAILFAKDRDDLRRWIVVKLDPRIRARLSPSNLIQEVYPAADTTSPSQAAIRDEILALLVAAVESMDLRDREVLTLRHFEDKTNDEVAASLGISRGTAGKRSIRALGRLRLILEMDGTQSRP